MSSSAAVMPEISLYPNPAMDHVLLQWPAGGDMEIEVQVMDVQGRQVSRPYKDRTGQLKVDLHDLSGGIYLVQAEFNGQRIVKKLWVR